ncbi:MAG: hypothetical protein KAI50_03190 [Desulfobacterales bacterium]|nr:hypothetical protein [Desulfobacterales bacterium]
MVDFDFLEIYQKLRQKVFFMVIEGFIWFTDIIDKIEGKHRLNVCEVESVFSRTPVFSKIEKGHIKDENLYRALGQTDSGRYISVFFYL